MFGKKEQPAEAPFDSEGYEQRFEYKILTALGVLNLEKAINDQARKGWELVSGTMAGTAHYAHLRRRLKPSADSAD